MYNISHICTPNFAFFMEKVAYLSVIFFSFFYLNHKSILLLYFLMLQLFSATCGTQLIKDTRGRLEARLREKKSSLNFSVDFLAACSCCE